MARLMARNVAVITGTPGTGKTTIAKQLAMAIDAEYLSLTQYVKKHRLYRGLDRQRRTKIVDLARTRRNLEGVLLGVKGFVVVDGHVSEAIVPAHLAKLVIVLRCHPKILETRLRAKKWAANKIRENVLAEILDSCLMAAVGYYGEQKVMQIDTSQKSVRKCLALAESALVGKRPMRRIKVDWLARIEKEGLLDRYLK